MKLLQGGATNGSPGNPSAPTIFARWPRKSTGQNLNYFFLQWIESSGAPEFEDTPSTHVCAFAPRLTEPGIPRRWARSPRIWICSSMPVTLHIETDGNPEDKTVEVVGTSSEFSVDTFGKPRPAGVTLDPKGKLLHCDDTTRVAVAIRRGEQFVEVGRVSGGAEGISEGAGCQQATVPWRIIASARCSSCKATVSPPPTRFTTRSTGDLAAQVDRGLVAHQFGQDLRHQRPARSRSERI